MLTDSASYAMTHVRRGKCVIISNKKFATTTQLASRRSADTDMNMLREAFSRLGFDVIIHCDRTALEMLAIVTESMSTFLYGIRQIFQLFWSRYEARVNVVIAVNVSVCLQLLSRSCSRLGINGADFYRPDVLLFSTIL